MSHPMAGWQDFLGHGTRTAKVAVTLKDGSPHVTPVWFLLDGDTIVFNTGVDSVKARALRRDPRVSVCVDLEEQPFAFVTVLGSAEVLPADPEWIRRIGERYGSTGGDYDPADNALVRVAPTKVIAVTYD